MPKQNGANGERMVTMREVAKAAGVSIKTVSNVVNDYEFVSQATRDKVNKAIDELGYTLNMSARNLRRGQTGIIGLAIPDLQMPYFAQLSSLVIEEAKKLGAMALFSEKYGDVVRVVNMGGYSVELCGGTHLDNTAKVGVFHIDSEFSVASGVRRIEAITGRATLECMRGNCCTINAVAEALKAKPADIVSKAMQEIQEIRELRHMVDAFRAKDAMGEAGRFLMGAKDVDGLKVLTATLNDAGADQLRKMGDFLRDKAPDVVAVLASANGEKITFLAVCGPEAVKRGIKAGDLVKSVCAICGGKGGGKPDSAMGGGSDLLKLDDALATVDDFVAEKLK